MKWTSKQEANLQSVILSNRKEGHWDLIHWGQNWKMLCIFQFNTSVYRLTALAWLLGEIATTFYSSLVLIKVMLCLVVIFIVLQKLHKRVVTKRNMFSPWKLWLNHTQWVLRWQWHRRSGCGHRARGPQWSHAGWRQCRCLQRHLKHS